ncbi:MAG: hypothetical protein H0U23_15095 [Blastocatellia bacterium]|nr:hypothetical protein [Blastocatellia bacterium]
MEILAGVVKKTGMWVLMILVSVFAVVWSALTLAAVVIATPVYASAVLNLVDRIQEAASKRVGS